MPETGSATKEDCPPPKINQIVLRVDDRTFHTTKETLTEESPYFSALLSGRWPDSPEDGKYTLDMDAEVFTHILRYLRSGVLPIFYDDSKGFDHALYCLVSEQAGFLGIGRLSKWIQGKRYLQAVKKVRSAEYFEDNIGLVSGSQTADTRFEHHFFWGNEKVYICPRGIMSHTSSENCGRQCRNARNEDAEMYEDKEVTRIVEVRTKVVFDHEVCLEGR